MAANRKFGGAERLRQQDQGNAGRRGFRRLHPQDHQRAGQVLRPIPLDRKSLDITEKARVAKADLWLSQVSAQREMALRGP